MSFFFDPAAGRKPDYRTLTQGETELLTNLGFLIMHWNKCEHFVRQILRQQVSAGSIDDAPHVAISKMMAFELETELKKLVRKLRDPGRDYIGHFAEGFGVAREHRNRFVHGLWETVGSSGPREATGVLLNSKPKAGMHPAPAFVTAADIAPVANHVFDLAVYAQPVHVAFNADGSRRFNADGALTVDPLPNKPTLLPPCTIEYFTQ